jgi:hypothetical protein
MGPEPFPFLDAREEDLFLPAEKKPPGTVSKPNDNAITMERECAWQRTN